MVLNLKHQTSGHFTEMLWRRVREAYISGNIVEYQRLLAKLIKLIQSNDITDAQALAGFNMVYERNLSNGQWQSMKNTRLIPIKDRYIAFISEGDL